MRLALALLAALVTLCAEVRTQVAVKSGMTADSHCGQDYCITALYSPSTQLINYTFVIPTGGKQVGWWSVAQGTGMKGANMAICWVNTDQSLTISHRSATQNDDPYESMVTVPTFSINAGVGVTTTNVTVWSWNMPVPAGIDTSKQPVPHIFAMNPTAPSTSATDAHLRKHTRDETGIKLDLSRAYTGAMPAGLAAHSSGSATTSDGDGNQQSSSTASTGEDDEAPTPGIRTRLMIVHAVFMLLAWMICVPLGILLARYGRTLFSWFPYHRGVQLAALLFALIGFFVAVAGVAVIDDAHFDNRHKQLGLALVILIVVQAALGASTHVLRKRYGKRSLLAFTHMPVGLIIFALSVWNIHEAFEVTDWQTPDYASYIIYAWAALMAVLYLVGFYKVRREVQQERNTTTSSQEKLQQQTSM